MPYIGDIDVYGDGNQKNGKNTNWFGKSKLSFNRSHAELKNFKKDYFKKSNRKSIDKNLINLTQSYKNLQISQQSTSVARKINSIKKVSRCHTKQAGSMERINPNDDDVRQSMKLIMDIPIDSGKTVGKQHRYDEPDSYRDVVVMNSTAINFNYKNDIKNIAHSNKR